MTLNDFISFDPSKDTPKQIPNLPGNYFVVIRDIKDLPHNGFEIFCKNFNGMKVIYTGRTGSGLRLRIGAQHLGFISGNSTLRQSLGCLFGFEQFPRDTNNPNNGHIRFTEENEITLTEWIKNNLIFYYYPCENHKEVEAVLIPMLNPPLNLNGKFGWENSPFRSSLSALRRVMPWKKNNNQDIDPFSEIIV